MDIETFLHNLNEQFKLYTKEIQFQAQSAFYNRENNFKCISVYVRVNHYVPPTTPKIIKSTSGEELSYVYTTYTFEREIAKIYFKSTGTNFSAMLDKLYDNIVVRTKEFHRLWYNSDKTYEGIEYKFGVRNDKVEITFKDKEEC